MKTERIIITFHEDGTFRGASTQDFGGMPKPLDESELSTILGTPAAQAFAENESLRLKNESLQRQADLVKNLSSENSELKEDLKKAMEESPTIDEILDRKIKASRNATA